MAPQSGVLRKPCTEEKKGVFRMIRKVLGRGAVPWRHSQECYVSPYTEKEGFDEEEVIFSMYIKPVMRNNPAPPFVVI